MFGAVFIYYQEITSSYIIIIIIIFNYHPRESNFLQDYIKPQRALTDICIDPTYNSLR